MRGCERLLASRRRLVEGRDPAVQPKPAEEGGCGVATQTA